MISRYTFLVLFIFIDVFSECFASDTKRLLLTDPDVINGRLTSLEQSMAQVQSEKRQLEEKVKLLETTVTTLQTHSNIGSTYTRWGKITCPVNNSTSMVYTGYAAGGIRSDSGGNQDLICLTSDAEFIRTTASDYGRIFGAEFDDDVFGNGPDVPCSVCHKQDATSIIMIPGRKTCYQGWTREYYGYLASGAYSHGHGVNYVCIDIKPDFLVAGDANTNNGPLIGHVVGKCGTLKCPPYHDNYAITCVVCSK